MQDLPSQYFYPTQNANQFQQYPLYTQYTQVAPQQFQNSMMPIQRTPINRSPYSSFYTNITEVLYFEQGDGEIFIYYDVASNIYKMVTCIDISTLYREKRGKAISVANYLCSLRHKNFIHIYRYFIHEERLIYVEMEVPICLTTWKTFCKKKFQPEEIFSVFQQVSEGIEYLHKMNFIHRDIHPSRIQCFNGNVIKFNLIGLPYNFKKLVKRDNFSGHINYSAPELILEKQLFSHKVDVWSLGCVLFYMITKKDPFDGKDPNEIKYNILNLRLDQGAVQNIPLVFKPLIEACFTLDDNFRVSSSDLVILIKQLQASLKLYQQPPVQNSQIQNLFVQSPQLPSTPQPINSAVLNQSPRKVIYQKPNSQESSPQQISVLNKQDVTYMMSSLSIQSQEFKKDFSAFVPQTKIQQDSKSSLFVQDPIKPQIISTSTITGKNIVTPPPPCHCQDDTSEDSQSSSFQEQLNSPLQGIEKVPSYEEKPYINFQKSITRQQPKPKVVYDEEGNIYEGEWNENKKNGKGKQIFPNGDVYNGTWKDGMMHGEGTMVYSSGDKYIGLFVKGMKHGKGVLMFKASGDSYDGEWQNDKQTGRGKYTYMRDQKIYDGDFVEGAPYGFGIMTCPTFFYKGYFKSGLFEGQGRLEDYLNQITFEGEYYDGKKRGYGKLTDLKSGDIFEGNWKEDMKEGPGKLISTKTNQIVVGIWQKNELKQIQSCTVYNSNSIESQDQTQ